MVIQYLAQLALALSFASATGVLWFPPSFAAEPARRVVRLGVVSPDSLATISRFVNAFWDRLREVGYVEGENLVVESRSANGQLDRLPMLMAELVERKVDVLVTWTTPAAIAAKNATSTVPIVVAVMGDPIGSGIAADLAHPGGNLTGLSLAWGQGIPGKWVELLKETVPRLSTIAVMGNPENQVVQIQTKELMAIAPTVGVKLRFIEVRKPEGLERAVKQARHEAQALLVLADTVTVTHRREITELVARHRLPAMYPLLDFANDGGLMAYAPDLAVMYRRAADYVDKILKGAAPGDLPIEQPTQYRLTLNLNAARALGLTIPESVLLRADEVIR